MSENCDIIAVFPIYGQFGAIQKQEQSVKLIFLLTVILEKLETEVKNFNTAHTILP